MRRSKEQKTRSKKEQCFSAALHFFLSIPSILVPVILLLKIVVKMTESFCDDHAALCDKFESSSNPNRSLIEQVKLIYGFGAFSILGGAVSSFALRLPGLWISNKLFPPRNIQDASQEKSSSLSSYDNHTNTCCRLFKKCMGTVLPTKKDLFQLVMSAASVLVCCAFLVWAIAILASGAICNNGVAACDGFFPNATAPELHELSDLSHKVYKASIGSGIAFSVISSIAFPLLAMTIIACVKLRMHRNAENRIAEIRKEQEGDDDGVIYYASSL